MQGLAAHVLEDLDPDFKHKVKPGDILVAGENFGCGSSREQAPIALQAAGISVVVARSFARIFYRNGVNIGLPLVEVPDHEIGDGARLEVNLTEGAVRDESGGANLPSNEDAGGDARDFERRRLNGVPQNARRLQRCDVKDLPLAGVRVLEFSHAVLGPAAGMILADLGADVIKVEPTPDGDPTRRLKGFGQGYFPYFNRNKKSLVLNLKTDEGLEVVHKLLPDTDVLLENYGPGTIERLGLGYDALKEDYPQLVFLFAQRLFTRPLRKPHRARRGGADDVGTRLHDRPAGSAHARGRVDHRRDDRDVRRDGGDFGAQRAGR